MAKKNQLTTSNPLPFDELTRFINRLCQDKEYQWAMYVQLSFCTACRASDVLKMRWKDVLGVPSITIVEKKTKKPRKISFNPSVQQKFDEFWRALDCPDKEEYIMKSTHSDQPFTIQYINSKLKKFKWKYRLSIENFSTHTFRKTFGRYVYESNNRSAESLILLNKILNHTSIQTTKTYIGITQEEVDGIFASISL